MQLVERHAATSHSCLPAQLGRPSNRHPNGRVCLITTGFVPLSSSFGPRSHELFWAGSECQPVWRSVMKATIATMAALPLSVALGGTSGSNLATLHQARRAAVKPVCRDRDPNRCPCARALQRRPLSIRIPVNDARSRTPAMRGRQSYDRHHPGSSDSASGFTLMARMFL